MIHLLRTNTAEVGFRYLANLISGADRHPMEKQSIFVASRAMEDWCRKTTLESVGTSSHLCFPYLSTFFSTVFRDLNLEAEDLLWGDRLKWRLFTYLEANESPQIAWDKATAYQSLIEELSLYRTNWVLNEIETIHRTLKRNNPSQPGKSNISPLSGTLEERAVKLLAYLTYASCEDETPPKSYAHLIRDAFHVLKNPDLQLPTYALLYPRALPPIGLLLLQNLSQHTDVHVVHYGRYQEDVLSHMPVKSKPKASSISFDDIERLLEIPHEEPPTPLERQSPNGTRAFLPFFSRAREQDHIIEHMWQTSDTQGPMLSAPADTTLGRLQHLFLGVEHSKLEAKLTPQTDTSLRIEAHASLSSAHDALLSRLQVIFQDTTLRRSDVAILLARPDRDLVDIQHLLKASTLDITQDERSQQHMHTSSHHQAIHPTAVVRTEATLPQPLQDIFALFDEATAVSASQKPRSTFADLCLPRLFARRARGEWSPLYSALWKLPESESSAWLSRGQSNHLTTHPSDVPPLSKRRIALFEKRLVSFAHGEEPLSTRFSLESLEPLMDLTKLAGCLHTHGSPVVECDGHAAEEMTAERFRTWLATCIDDLVELDWISSEHAQHMHQLSHALSIHANSNIKQQVTFWLQRMKETALQTTNPSLFKKDTLVIGDLAHLSGVPFRHVIAFGFEAEGFPSRHQPIVETTFELRTLRADPNARSASLMDFATLLTTTTKSVTVLGVGTTDQFDDVFDPVVRPLVEYTSLQHIEDNGLPSAVTPTPPLETDAPMQTMTTHIDAREVRFHNLSEWFSNPWSKTLSHHLHPSPPFHVTHHPLHPDTDKRVFAAQRHIIDSTGQIDSFGGNALNGDPLFKWYSEAHIVEELVAQTGYQLIRSEIRPTLDHLSVLRKHQNLQPLNESQFQKRFQIYQEGFQSRTALSDAWLKLDHLRLQHNWDRLLPKLWLIWLGVTENTPSDVMDTRLSLTAFSGDRLLKISPKFSSGLEDAQQIEHSLSLIKDIYLLSQSHVLELDLRSLLSYLLGLKNKKQLTAEAFIERHDTLFYQTLYTEQRFYKMIPQAHRLALSNDEALQITEQRDALLRLVHRLWDSTCVEEVAR